MRPCCRWRGVNDNPFALGPWGQRRFFLFLLVLVEGPPIVVGAVTHVFGGRQERKACFLPLHPLQAIRLATFLCHCFFAFLTSALAFSSYRCSQLAAWELGVGGSEP
jgi:hypothetical protein